MVTGPVFPDMAQHEAQALVSAIAASYGPCLCQQHQAIAGHRVWIDVCAGHAFLNEPGRLARLLWVRRTQHYWRIREWGSVAALLQYDMGL